MRREIRAAHSFYAREILCMYLSWGVIGEAAEHRYDSVAGGAVPENMESLWAVISRGKNRFMKVRFKG